MTIGLELTRSQILTFRRRAASLDERLPRGQGALRRGQDCKTGLPDQAGPRKRAQDSVEIAL